MVMISSIFKQKKNLHTSHAWAVIKTTSKIDTDSAVAIFTYRLNILPKLMEKRRVRTLATGLFMIKLEAKSQSSANRTKEAHTSSPSAKLTKLKDQYFPVSTKLTMLKEELKTLIDHEEEIEEKLEGAYKALKKVEQQENTNHRQSVDDTLEIMILNKEISKISLENMRLEKELDEANQDTKILLKQVSELLAVPENRNKDKMPIKGGGSFKKNYYYSTDQD